MTDHGMVELAISPDDAAQRASELMISPFPLVPRAHQTLRLIVFLMNRTLPSPSRTLTPPGW